MNRKKQTKHIGQLSGKVLVFGGVYSNFQALTQMRLIAEQENIAQDHIICTGDVVAYCAQPEQSVQAIKEWGVHTIAGNVEIQLGEGSDDCGCNFETGTTCNILSNQWYPYAQRKLSQDSIQWMKALPDFINFDYAGRKVIVLHGSINETDIVLAGHCGLPFSESQDGKHWINAGVIGMPANDATTDVWYAILEEVNDELTISHHRMEYDHTKAAHLMEASHLPIQYSKTLVTGIWDNCDILPEIETSLQGSKIDWL